MHFSKLPLCCLVLFGLLAACERTYIVNPPNLPPNPFDEIDYTTGVMGSIPIDSQSFLGLYTYVFRPSCAQPGCHDGNFEPDFRTIGSAYNSLVYHPVIKNTPDQRFTYRVVPGDRSESWLWERVTTDNTVLGRMPLYDTLTDGELGAIRDWINMGAPDVLGINPLLPNYRPTGYGWQALDALDTAIRYENNRADIISPMELPRDTEIDWYFGLYDTDADGEPIFGPIFGYNRLQISEHPYDFSGATEIALDVLPADAPIWGNPYYTVAGNLPHWLGTRINTANFQKGKVYFVRVLVDDGEHQTLTSWPEADSPAYLISIMSFVIP